jgi:hypothetical protein
MKMSFFILVYLLNSSAIKIKIEDLLQSWNMDPICESLASTFNGS